MIDIGRFVIFPETALVVCKKPILYLSSVDRDHQSSNTYFSLIIFVLLRLQKISDAFEVYLFYFFFFLSLNDGIEVSTQFAFLR